MYMYMYTVVINYFNLVLVELQMVGRQALLMSFGRASVVS